ncbi:MAG: adenylate/guanylate cyclase domain-containing protein, partial [Cyanobacteria bacterium]|nr:adenylate/guanylate cyclase domain-containing protein [Cyanobacteriota bacterium]MDW8202599.1 adenylate/guanylate cyclase domain-containing protein [Cyanobacteriota bacterium SKYGB_h_bin112]
YLIDLGSRNGTFVNGRRVTIPVPIQSGDHITFGQTELEFYCPHSVKLTKSDNNELDTDNRETTATAILHVRKLISVLVIDIRNFTGLTRQMDEKILSEMIGSWFRQAGQIIRTYGSWVDKYIGDAIMAVWIHESENVSHDEMLQIFRALSALYNMTSTLATNYPLPFPLRIGAGINTGYAMVGNTGSGDRPDYTALGDTVNAAFRLESSTKQIGCDVALGEQTYAHLAPLVTDKSLFKSFSVDLKGYEVPMTTFACTFEALDQFLATYGVTTICNH